MRDDWIKKYWELWLSIPVLYFASDKDRKFYLTAATVGPVFEMACVNVGMYEYTEKDVLGVPFWLFPSWGLFGLVFRKISQEIEKRL